MSIKNWICILFGCWCLLFHARGQSSYLLGTLPAINFNKGINETWAFNSKWESRQTYLKGAFGGDIEKNAEYVLSDFAFLFARKTGLQSKIIGGYLIRLSSGKPIHRLIQQYTFVQRLRNYRLAHRLATDQTLKPNSITQFRLRYRIGLELPFSGQAVDPREFYMKLTNEYLNAWEASDYSLEFRLVPMFGYKLTDGNKFELGLNYRAKSPFERNTRHSFWIAMNWYTKI